MRYIDIDGVGPVLFERSRRARRIIISVNSTRGVRVAVPPRASYGRAAEFARGKAGWIRKQQSLIRQAERSFGNVAEIDRPAARRRLVSRLEELARIHGFSYNRVFVRNQRTRWGSCSAVNNISLNVKLTLLPAELSDYVLLHELLHTRIKDHSRRFWSELDQYVGEARSRATELRKYGLVLL